MSDSLLLLFNGGCSIMFAHHHVQGIYFFNANNLFNILQLNSIYKEFV